MTKKKRRISNWLFYPIRIVGMDHVSFAERWRIRINRFQLLSIFILLSFLIFTLSYLLFSYTPLGKTLPDNVTDKSRNEILEAYAIVEDMEIRINQQDLFIKNLQRVIRGDVEFDSIYQAENGLELVDDFLKMDTTRTDVELELQRSVKQRELENTAPQPKRLNELYLLDPVSGRLSQRFHPTRHPAVDIVTAPNEPILACLEGVVIHRGYDDLDGWIIMIKHPNDILSVYKHCSKVLKEVGDIVKAGDPIGIVGNTGKRTTGPHLHFELWSSQGPLNPTDYLSFGR